MKLLLEWGAGANARALAKALRNATIYCHLQCMKLLLEWGATLAMMIKYLQKNLLNLPVYLFPQIILQKKLNKNIKKEMKEILKKEKENFIQYHKYLHLMRFVLFFFII